MNTKESKTLVVIGGGAAGFFCAVNAARLNPDLKVILIEKNNKLLSKVKVSGGGRCNVTHACFDIVELSKRYPRGEKILKKAFHWFNSKDTVDWFEQRGVGLKTEPDGRMFPQTNTSQTIIDCLLREANKYNIEILISTDVKQIKRTENQFELVFQNTFTPTITANYVCVACGGFPKIEQFSWLTQFGHTIENPVPSLFTFNIPNTKINELMGVSVESATVKIVGSKLQSSGPMLITHWGLSGPAVLKLSAFAARDLASKSYSFEILVNWLPPFNEQTFKDEITRLRNEFASHKIHSKNSFGMPNRLWDFLLKASLIEDDLRWADLPAKKQNDLVRNVTTQSFLVKGKTTFKEEFVTCGGIKLTEVDVNTMQSKIVDNLFFAGEILDIDGITGGFNFQNAWTTGWIAAKAIAKKSLE